jgi:hypothetical protein
VGNANGRLGVGLVAGFVSGYGNGVGTQMIGNRGGNLSLGDYAWAGVDGVLGAGETGREITLRRVFQRKTRQPSVI